MEASRLANLVEIFSEFTDLRLVGESLTADVQCSSAADSCAAEMLRLLQVRFTRTDSDPNQGSALDQWQ